MYSGLQIFRNSQNNEQGDDGSSVVKRAKRIESHALVDVKMSSWNPLSVASAVLLDLSWQGFKIEFVNPVKVKAGARLSMSICSAES